MKTFIAAFALVAALPAAASAQSPPAGHGEHHGQHHGGGEHKHDGKDCCEHKSADGKPMECCQPGKDGKRPACCEGKHGDGGKHAAGHKN